MIYGADDGTILPLWAQALFLWAAAGFALWSYLERRKEQRFVGPRDPSLEPMRRFHRAKYEREVIQRTKPATV